MNADTLRYKAGMVQTMLALPVRMARIKNSIEHVFGPQEVVYDNDELIALCVVRDGQYYMESFIEHYLSKGIKHIVFLDNGSRDQTIPIAKKYKHVTILSCLLPYRKYEIPFALYLINRFANRRWSLRVDIDELFDFPFSHRIGLSSLLAYLNSYGYNAAITQMLDMFSGQTMSDTTLNRPKNLCDTYRFYNISEIKKEPYRSHFGNSNIVSNNDIRVYFGGIRKKKFNLDKVCLTKHSLIYYDKKIKPVFKKNNRVLGHPSAHGVANAKLADLTCVLYHFKFTIGLHEQAKFAVKENNHYRKSFEYRHYLNVLNETPGLNMKDDDAVQLGSVDDLVENGLLNISENYMQWVETSPGVSE